MARFSRTFPKPGPLMPPNNVPFCVRRPSPPPAGTEWGSRGGLGLGRNNPDTEIHMESPATPPAFFDGP